MLANYLIGLREGLEASLVVGILVAYLVRTGNRSKLAMLWAGVAIAILLSLAFGFVLTYTSASMSFTDQEKFGGFASLIAVIFVTWMVFWMKRVSRGLKGELHGKLDSALATGGWALALTAFIAVAREGLETALFIWTAVQSTGQTTAPLLGAALGLATSVLLGWLIYRGALKLNLAVFFRWTGAALIVVAAGVLAYGIHDLQEAGVLPGLNNLAFDLSSVTILGPSAVLGAVLKGVFNFSTQTTVLQVIAWTAYLVPTMTLYLWPARTTPSTPAVAHVAVSA